MYKAHGSGASWEWLAHISPCVDFLRRLAREFHRTLGDDQGTKHAPTDLSRSIHTLIRSFAANEVHTIKPGRFRADADGVPVTDIITEGMRQLVHGADGPIAKFNRAFTRLQKRRKLVSVSKQWEEFESGPAHKCTSYKPENQILPGTKQTEDGAESEDEKGNKITIDNEINYSDTESETGEQDGQSGSESGADKLESEESEGEDFWEEAFNLELELGEEAFNRFGDTMSEEEAPEYDEPDDNNNSFVDDL
jgi:hypothetical protein